MTTLTNQLVDWNGKPLTITNKSNSYNLKNTINGDTVLVMQNLNNSSGNVNLKVTSGGGLKKEFTLQPSKDGLPTLFVHNYEGQNINLEVTSESEEKLAVTVAAVGPGMYEQGELPRDSKEHDITPIYEKKCTCEAPFTREGSMPASPAVLSFGQRSQNVACFVQFTGAKAACYGVNLEPGNDLPEPYEPIGENGSSTGNIITVSKNFYGSNVTVANVSPNVSGISFAKIKS
ncbi:hypothetical protein L4C38_20545 [Vibrio kasasachensis]|uniref:hypothetical protein n=1 Tax=Vibrio kasasachensis TaxID=2910248 RepID=UPI003D0E6CF3